MTRKFLGYQLLGTPIQFADTWMEKYGEKWSKDRCRNISKSNKTINFFQAQFHCCSHDGGL